MNYFLIIISLGLIASCSSTKMNNKTFNDRLPKFDYEAHRGYRGMMPENTINAMLYALGEGATTLEMDISFTKNKKLILSHEPFFNHEITTKPDGSFIDVTKEKDYNIYKMNYDVVKTYDVGLKPHPRFPQQTKVAAVKPLLTDVFTAVKNYMLTAKRPEPFFNIETKAEPATDNIYHPAPAEFVDKLMKEIDAAGLLEQVIIQSFDFRTLQIVHKDYPGVYTAMLVEKTDNRSFRKQLDDLGFTPTIYSPELGLVTENLVKDCHEKGIRVIPWTVDDKADLNRLKKLRVDGYISDYPKRNLQ